METLKAIDLRINNYLTYDSNEDIEQVKAINNTDWFGEGKVWLETTHIGGELIENFKPIPLTEEWLLSFGFEQNGDISYKLRETGFVILVYGGIFKHNVTGKEFKYVHKLQNFYYELKDEELIHKQNG